MERVVHGKALFRQSVLRVGQEALAAEDMKTDRTGSDGLKHDTAVINCPCRLRNIQRAGEIRPVVVLQHLQITCQFRDINIRCKRVKMFAYGIINIQILRRTGAGGPIEPGNASADRDPRIRIKENRVDLLGPPAPFARYIRRLHRL